MAMNWWPMEDRNLGATGERGEKGELLEPCP